MNIGKCKDCGAAIIWSVTVSGSRIPLNPIPIRVAFGDVDEAVSVREVHSIHFTTCTKTKPATGRNQTQQARTSR